MSDDAASTEIAQAMEEAAKTVADLLHAGAPMPEDRQIAAAAVREFHRHLAEPRPGDTMYDAARRFRHRRFF